MHGERPDAVGRTELVELNGEQVGTILSLVNQGSVVLGGEAGWLTWLRVGVNYLTPFVVASIGYLAGCRAELAAAWSCQEGKCSCPSTGSTR